MYGGEERPRAAARATTGAAARVQRWWQDARGRRHALDAGDRLMAPPSDAPRLRRDAEVNRRRLLAAAREVFRDRGLRATLDDVAHHAGLGVGTAYRHFRNKDALIDALFDDMLARVEEVTREGAEDPDAWRGLATHLERVAELQALDRGLREVLLGTGRPMPGESEFRYRIGRHVDLMVERAKAQGVLRPDAEPWDLMAIQLMVAAVTDRTGRPDLWRRYLHLLLDGLRAGPEPREPLPCGDLGEPPTPPGRGFFPRTEPSPPPSPPPSPSRSPSPRDGR
ncbi:TetR/AcrR family transcriptional regulator [Streptomyces sp. NPDC059477]|uniref:TetR/AcrR family transcriptional regulator n=1 Tax=Streptomyces sp. NPDC059477 TaxID=3346847 RepID=UPI00368A202F